jgi:hypothetical protein
MANPAQLSIPFNGNPSQINATEAQLPSAIIEAMRKEMEGLKMQVQNIDKFKQTQEERQVKQASEEQRAMIESFITADVIPDEASRAELVDWLVSLNLDDENVKKILDLVVNGSFTSSSSAKPADKGKGNPAGNVASAAKEPRGRMTPNGDIKLAVLKKVKGAAIMNNRPEVNTRSRRMYPVGNEVGTAGILSGVNVDNFPF